MDSSTELITTLAHLVASLELAGDLPETLQSFTAKAQQAVATYQGVRIGLVDHGHEVVLTAFVPGADPATIGSTVRVPLDALAGRNELDGLDGAADPGSTLVLYATVPGAFVDLAADLSHALHLPLHSGRPVGPAPTLAPRRGERPEAEAATATSNGSGSHVVAENPQDRAVRLDQDLPPIPATSGLWGLEDRSRIDLAIGVLIDRGHSLEAAYATLHHHARTNGIALATAARVVLARRTEDGPAAQDGLGHGRLDGHTRHGVLDDHTTPNGHKDLAADGRDEIA